MAGSSGKTVQTIDHEPPDQYSSQENAPIFGKRQTAFHPSRDLVQAAQEVQPDKPDGISEYFINRVTEHQAGKYGSSPRQSGREYSHATLRRSAIRDTNSDRETIDEELAVPYKSLAAVAFLAFAIPIGFIYATETLGRIGNTIDPITTSSVRTADGIGVREVSMTKILKNGTFVVTVHGKVANLSSRNKTLLPLTISLRDKNGKEVQSWRHQIGKSNLDQGATLHFMTSAIDYSGKAKTAHVLARTTKPVP